MLCKDIGAVFACLFDNSITLLQPEVSHRRSQYQVSPLQDRCAKPFGIWATILRIPFSVLRTGQHGRRRPAKGIDAKQRTFLLTQHNIAAYIGRIQLPPKEKDHSYRERRPFSMPEQLAS